MMKNGEIPYIFARRQAGITIESASEYLHYESTNPLRNIERGKTIPGDDTVDAMVMLYGALWLEYEHVRHMSRHAADMFPPLDIIAVGKDASGHYYVLRDRSRKDSPNGWAQMAINTHHELSGDRIIGEINNGGEMVEAVLRSVDMLIPYSPVVASRGKITRAEPIAALYEQGKVHHVGSFPELEDQMCEWEPGMKSPDRMDALVWGITYLSTKQQAVAGRKPAGW